MARPKSVGTPATLALDGAGLAYVVHPYVQVPSDTAYGAQAAASLGVDPSRVFKTLLSEADGALMVAVVPVSGTLDLKALAAAVGAKRAAMAQVSDAERATGYVVGGISPFGQRRALPTVLDDSARAHDTIYVSAGRRGVDLEVTPGDLVHLLAAWVADIARPSGAQGPSAARSASSASSGSYDA